MSELEIDLFLIPQCLKAVEGIDFVEYVIFRVPDSTKKRTIVLRYMFLPAPPIG